MKATTASSSPETGVAGRGCVIPSRAMAGSSLTAMRCPGRRRARTRAIALRDRDHVPGRGPAQGTMDAAHAEARVGDDDAGPDAPAGVDDGEQVGTRGDEDRDPVAAPHARGPRGPARAGRRCGGAATTGPSATSRRRAARRAPRRAGRRSRARRGPPRAAPRRCVADAVRAARPVRAGEVPHPGEQVADQRGGVLAHQVPGALVAVHVGLRQPGEEVVEVAVGEHRVPGAPQQQHRHVQRPDPLGDRRRGRRRWDARARTGCPRRRRPRPPGGRVDE